MNNNENKSINTNTMKHGVFAISEKEELKTNAKDGEYPILEEGTCTKIQVRTNNLVKISNGYIDQESLIKATDEFLIKADKTKEVADHYWLEGAWFNKETNTISLSFGS